MITANLATIKSRKSTLLQVIDSLLPQVDLVRVYANDYEPKINRERVEVVTGKDYTDNGKFYWLPESKGIYLSCDDDLIYPYDYVDRIIKAMKRYPGCWITFHGRKMVGLGLDYYRGHIVYPCLKKVSGDYELDVPGTGVSAFNTKDISFDMKSWKFFRMSDIMVAQELAKKKIKIICLSHEEGWIKHIENDFTIYHSEIGNFAQNEQADLAYLSKYGQG
jgi:hypothetical protein